MKYEIDIVVIFYICYSEEQKRLQGFIASCDENFCWFKSVLINFYFQQLLFFYFSYNLFINRKLISHETIVSFNDSISKYSIDILPFLMSSL